MKSMKRNPLCCIGPSSIYDLLEGMRAVISAFSELRPFQNESFQRWEALEQSPDFLCISIFEQQDFFIRPGPAVI